MKKPNPVRWLPDTELARVLMFKVSSKLVEIILVVFLGLEKA